MTLLQELDEDIEQRIADAARQDPAVFCSYVLRDEETGGPIVNADVHREWHDLIAAHRRLVIVSAIELGKTQQIGVGRTLFELGRNPNVRAVVACNTAGQASKIGQVVARYIEQSPELHRVFPHLKPAPSGPWNSTALTVQRSTFSKDPSVQCVGLHGNILGARVDFLVLDDICDYENTRTPAAREDASRWIASTLLGRLTDASTAVAAGNVWRHDDPQAQLARERGWHREVYPAEVWPERWSPDRIARARVDLGPREAARQLDCIPPADADPTFPVEHVGRAVELGAEAATEFLAAPAGRLVDGVDIAFSTSGASDLSAIVRVRVNAENGRREVLQVSAGRWGFDGLCNRVVHQAQSGRSTVAVETNGGGAFVLEHVKKAGVKAVGVHTSASSKATALDILAAELAQERWAFMQPAGVLDPEMRALVQEVLDYSPDEHTGDRFSALLTAVNVIRTLEQRPKGRCFFHNLHRARGL